MFRAVTTLLACSFMSFSLISTGKAQAEQKTEPIQTTGVALRHWESTQGGTKQFTIGGLNITLSAVNTGDKEDEVAQLEATAPGIKTLVLKAEDSSVAGGGVRANFDVFPIDPKNSRKDVLFTWFTGGAHCCARVLVASLIGDDWKISDLGTWDDGRLIFNHRPTDLNGDGQADFVFFDDSFLYAFDAYAGSVCPRRILNVESGHVVDKSTDPTFARLHREDMMQHEQGCRKHWNSACAAFVASAARLGQFKRAWGIMLKNYDRESYRYTICDGPSKQCLNPRTTDNFPDALANLLKREGYIK